MNNHLIEELLTKLKENGKWTTPSIRALSRTYYEQIKKKSFDDILILCESMLSKRYWPLSIIAFDWAYRQRNQYREDTFDVFERWQFNYIRDWYDCDDFNTHAFGYLLVKYPHLSFKVTAWANHEAFAVRRAIAVVLIVPIKKKTKHLIDPLVVSTLLMQDPHYLVQKGYGWMLKIYMQNDETRVTNYLTKHYDVMPRTAYRYAIENLSKEKKSALM